MSNHGTSLEEQARTELRHLTEDVVGGPDLATAVTSGRRRRRRTTAVAGVAALALAGSVGGVAFQQLHGPARTVAVDTPFAGAPSYRDFVPGTQVDETIQGTVASHLVPAPDADDVFPSDWNHDAKNPDVAYQNATEWQAYYTPSPQETLRVTVGKAIPGYPLDPQCTEIAKSSGQPPCVVVPSADGGQVSQYGFVTIGAPRPYSFLTVRTNPDGSTVIVAEQVDATSWEQAGERRVYADDQTRALADDPALTFPDPVVTPPDPAGP